MLFIIWESKAQSPIPARAPAKKPASKNGSQSAKAPSKPVTTSPPKQSNQTTTPPKSNTNTQSSAIPSSSSKPVNQPTQTRIVTSPSPAPTPAPVVRKSSTPIRSRRVHSNGFRQGDNLLNLGVGLSSYYYGNPVGISYEVGVKNDISIGGQIDYNRGNYYGYSGGYTSYYLGGRGSYHFNNILNLKNDKIDLYAGLGLGIQTFRWNDSSYGYGNGYRSGLFFNYFIGGKYYFSNKIGGFAEFGYTGLSSARVGLAVKF